MKTVKQAIDSKLAYVSEDRKVYGLNLIGEIKENMTIAARPKFFSKHGVINGNDEIVAAEEYKKRIQCQGYFHRAGGWLIVGREPVEGGSGKVDADAAGCADSG